MFVPLATRCVIHVALCLLLTATVHAQPNLLANHEFDTGLASWERVENRTAEWDSVDLWERPASGSVLLTHDQPISGGNLIILRQCVPIAAPGGYRISGWIRNLADQAVPGNGSIIVQPARNADCTGGFGNHTGPASSGSPNWVYREWDFAVSHATVPYQAVMVSLAIQKAQAVTTPRRVRFDHITLRYLDGPSPPVSIFVQHSGDGVGRVTSEPAGIDCGSACVHPFAAGTHLRLDATPQNGYAFTRWTSGPCIGSSSPVCRFTVEVTDTAGAEFTTQQTLSVMFDGNGSGRVTSQPDGVDCTASCSTHFDAGGSVSLTATPDAGSVFVGWQDDAGASCGGLTGICTISMTASRHVVPRFELATTPTRRLDVLLDGTGSVISAPAGIQCAPACQANFPQHTAVSLTATASPGFAFVAWTGACLGNAPQCNVVLSADRTVTARFAPETAVQHLLMLAVTGNGRVQSLPAAIDCPGHCDQAFDQGSSVTLLAQPAPGHVFDGWSGDCSGTGDCVVTMDRARQATAGFVVEGLQIHADGFE